MTMRLCCCCCCCLPVNDTDEWYEEVCI